MSPRETISLPVYAALTIPTVTAYPSVNCLQWSADGQLCFVSKNAVHILVYKRFYDLPTVIFLKKESIQTPDPGINFDSTSVVKSTPSKDDPALGWFKTMVQRDTAMPISWPDYSQGVSLPFDSLFFFLR